MSKQSQIDALRDFWGPKIVIVGQQPNANDPEDPLAPDNPMWAGYRLMSLAGLTPGEYRDRFQRINLNYEAESKFRVSTPQRHRAMDIFTTVREDDILVILGTAVEKAFKGLLPPLQPCIIQKAHRNVDVVLIPHPSGLNRWWNDPMNTKLAVETLKQVIDHNRVRRSRFV